MKKWIFGLGAFALSFAMLVSPMDSKVQAAESATVSDNDAGSVSDNDAGSTTTKTKLATPTGLTWDGWNAVWNTVENANGAYRVQFYKDGSVIHSIHFATSTIENETKSYNFGRELMESGVYKFTVQAVNDYDPDNFEDSEVSEFSIEKTYVRPEAELGNIVGSWDNAKEGYFNVPVIEGADRYALELYYTPVDGVEHRRVTSFVPVKQGEILSRNYNSYFQEYGAGKYRIKVQALSADVDAVANGQVGEFSNYYDTTVTSSAVNNQLNEYIVAGTATEAKQNIMSNIPQANLATSMQTDATVLETIKQLEAKYAAEKGITVAAPAVSEEAGKYVKAEEINVVGAGLNGKDGNTVKLDVSVPEKKETVSSQHYANSVQLDIKLMSNSTSIHKLDMPITITMKVPTGIDVERLVILHYHQDGSYENVTPLVNGDGTITFTVTEFSTFVFAEKAGGNTGSGEAQQPQDEEEENDDDDEEEVKEEKSATPAKDNVPKTGDSLPIALPMTAAVCLAGAAVILKKKEN